MAFPQDLLDIDVALFIAGAWVDITGDVRRDPGMVRITRGRADESRTAAPSKAIMTLDNRALAYSDRDPMSPNYGLLGRNTPLRIQVGAAATPNLYVPGAGTGAPLSTPDHSSLDITGDIDIRMELTPDTWRPNRNYLVASKWTSSGDQRSWIWQVTTLGYLKLWHSADGVASIAATSTAPVPVTSARRAIRVTLDVNNGSGGKTWTFYTADSIGGSWTQLGAPVTTAGTTSIFSSSARLEIGTATSGTLVHLGEECRLLHGEVYEFELRSSIGGTVVADPDIPSQTPGDPSWSAGSKVWTAGTTARLLADARFYGEVTAWVPRGDSTGRDLTVGVEASGVRQRLGQGASPLESTLRRGLTGAADPGVLPVAYWPCEDGDGSTALGSALPGHPPMTIGGEVGSSSDVFACSAPVPTVGSSIWAATVPAYVSSGTAQTRWLMTIPSGLTNGAVVARIMTSGSVARWDVVYTTATSGSLDLRAYDGGGTLLFTSSTAGLLNDTQQRIAVELDQNGADIAWQLYAVRVAGPFTAFGPNGTLAGHTFGRVTGIRVNPGGNLGDAALGHVSVQNTITDVLDLEAELEAFAGETAGARMARLCALAEVPLTIRGELAATAAVGAQRVATLLELLDECAAADGGILHEPRSEIGLTYRTRDSMYNQPATATIDHAAGELAVPLDPTEDDLAARNDVTVSRVAGTSARAVLETGRMSVLPPPDGVGRYDEAVALNLATDAQLPDQASWRLGLGTVDEQRIPTVLVDRTVPGVAANADLDAAIQTVDAGDRIVIRHPPAGMPADDISQIVQGYTETLGNKEHAFALTCAPASPWRVAVIDDYESRLDTIGSELASGVDADDTTLSVATTAGPLWTADQADTPFDLRVGGEVVRVVTVGTQLVSNAFLDTNVTGWTPSGCALAHSTALERPNGAGVGTMRITPDGVAAAGGAGSALTGVGTVTPAAAYLASAWAYSAAGWADLRMLVNWHNAAGGFISTSLAATATAAAAGTWTPLHATLTAPALASQAAVWVWHSGTPPGSMVWHAWAIRLSPVASHATSPQTLQVVRSVDGTVKSHASGATVQLARPSVIAL